MGIGLAILYCSRTSYTGVTTCFVLVLGKITKYALPTHDRAHGKEQICHTATLSNALPRLIIIDISHHHAYEQSYD